MATDPIKQERERTLRECIPDLFTTRFKSVLYVGANTRRQHLLDSFKENSYRITILEIFDKNVEFLKEKLSGTDISVMQGDVRNVDGLNLGRFDTVFYWHGIDCLPREDIIPTISKLEKTAEHLIVLGVPFGRYPDVHTSYNNNKNDIQASPVYPDFLEGLGYKTRTLGPQDTQGSSIISWKRLNQ